MGLDFLDFSLGERDWDRSWDTYIHIFSTSGSRVDRLVTNMPLFCGKMKIMGRWKVVFLS